MKYRHTQYGIVEILNCSDIHDKKVVISFTRRNRKTLKVVQSRCLEAVGELPEEKAGICPSAAQRMEKIEENRKRREKRRADIMELYLSGKNIEEIAEVIGLSYERVRQIIVSMKTLVEEREKAFREKEIKELRENFKNYLHNKDCIPTFKELSCSRRVEEEYYNLSKSAIKSGFSTRRIKKAREKAIIQLQELAKELGSTPTQRDLAEAGIYHTKFFTLFGSLTEAQRLAGLEPNPIGRQKTQKDGIKSR